MEYTPRKKVKETYLIDYTPRKKVKRTYKGKDYEELNIDVIGNGKNMSLKLKTSASGAAPENYSSGDYGNEWPKKPETNKTPEYKKPKKMTAKQVVLRVTSLLSLASIGCGVVHGFCDAQNRNLDSTIENALTYGPAAVHGAVGGLLGLVGGSVIGGVTGYEMFHKHRTARTLGAVAGIPVGAAVGTAIVGGVCAGIGALETLAGYGIGYGVGMVLQ
jgi:hypothetical protein